MSATDQDQTTAEILDEVAFEVESQNEQWGEQNHTLVYDQTFSARFAAQEQVWKEINEARAYSGQVTWDGVLLEEVYEALSGTSDTRTELVQVAAVAVSMIASIDRMIAAVPTEPEVVETESAKPAEPIK